VIFCLFFANWPRIQSTLKETGLLERLSEKPTQKPDPSLDIPQNPEVTGIADDPASPAEPLAEAPPETPQSPAVPETRPAAPPVKPPVSVKAPAAGSTRDRSVYFIRVDGDGAILRIPVTRSVAVSSPLADSLRILIRGPTEEEKRRGLITLIPPGTEFLSAEIRGSTAYISFNDTFKFNDYGVEGYVGQLRQIIWTATEFPNITNVQILIEGRVVEYLGERIKIGSPLGRDSF
jgi:hypothetical protein